MTVEQLKDRIKQRFAAKDQLIVIIRAHSALPPEPEEATDLETALDSLEQIEVETVDPFDDDENGEFHVAEIVLE